MIHNISLIIIFIIAIFTAYKLYQYHTKPRVNFDIKDKFWYYGPSYITKRVEIKFKDSIWKYIQGVDKEDTTRYYTTECYKQELEDCKCDSLQALCPVHTDNWQHKRLKIKY
jgi:hypothetical protein